MAATGLSVHRVGMLLARNGKLVERLRAGGRIWPETEAAIRERLRVETAQRIPPTSEDAA